MNATCTYRPSSLPLTKENLSKHAVREDAEPSFTLLSRYYNELPLPSPVLSARRERRDSSNTTTSDFVVASPRLSPFPYHNDSLFLPTAEQHQHSTISSRRSNSPTPSIDTLSNHHYPFRRASAAERRPSPLATIPPRRQTSAPPLDRSTRKPKEQDRQSLPRKARKWWLWISELLTIKLKKKNKASSMTGSRACATPCRLTENSPVWYSQFAANPPPPTSMATAA
ncbi:hypothetical protein BJV82DRAFT_594312 [Fennellomyces sp. T-0311]|nr:hypothetical protein BJV82DRAFT_594312 [Fennellomyces sp. T-0311]